MNDEFATPPPELWQNMPPTLRVVAQLRDAGIIDPTLARSVYRSEAVNACAGGSAGSKHRENRAIDFDLPPNPDNVARLCELWREQGPALNLGLGFYTPTAIHIDTAGLTSRSAVECPHVGQRSSSRHVAVPQCDAFVGATVFNSRVAGKSRAPAFL